MTDVEPKPPALIVGRPNANLLAQARALGRNGVPIVCLLNRGEPPTIARVSRYVQRVIVAIGVSDEVIAAHIREVARSAGTKPVLFFGGDYDITLVARIWAQISDVVVPVTEPLRASELNDKHRQTQILENAGGIPVPRSSVLHCRKDIETQLGRFTYPVICRPVELARRGSFPGKILIADDLETVRQRLAPVLDDDGADVLVQEYVPGGSECLYFALALCDETGDALQIVLGRKLFEYPEGLMCVGETVSNPDLESVARRTFRTFGLGGILGLEFKRDPRSDQFYFIEANFRPENILAVTERMGVNLCLGAYQRALGHAATQPVSLGQHIPTVWRDLSLVALSSLSGAYPRRAMGRFSRNRGRSRRVDAYLAWDDPMPAMAWYWAKVWRLIRAKFFGNSA